MQECRPVPRQRHRWPGQHAQPQPGAAAAAQVADGGVGGAARAALGRQPRRLALPLVRRKQLRRRARLSQDRQHKGKDLQGPSPKLRPSPPRRQHAAAAAAKERRQHYNHTAAAAPGSTSAAVNTQQQQHAEAEAHPAAAAPSSSGSAPAGRTQP